MIIAEQAQKRVAFYEQVNDERESTKIFRGKKNMIEDFSGGDRAEWWGVR